MNKILLGASLGLVLLLSPGVFAQTDTVTDENTTDSTTGIVSEGAKRDELKKAQAEKRAEREAKLDERQANKCEKVKLRAELLAEKLDVLSTDRNGRYQNVVEKLTALSARIDENSQADVTDLNVQISELSVLVADFQLKAATYKAAVSNIAVAACSEDADVREAVDKAKAARAEVRESANIVKVYVKNVIKPTLQALKDELSAEKEESAETSEEPTTDEQTSTESEL